MPSQTKSQLVAENATLRARLAELEARLASRTPGKGKELPESDITERKRIEDALNASEVRYRRFFETAKDGILILDGDTGRITDANPFLQELLGYSHADLLGKTLWEIGPFRLLGGEAMISGKPGEGTLVRVTLPVGKGAVSNA